ncbi:MULTISPECIES: Rpn family recombination-promoting nuclease/putative transposase [unclassified Thiocapsa]|uniref:Rpn family recombination-promoting nuclease/putative transposase n=1 Tax=unclassified Thiocapsa TaxID=2641286 RepID=UPI0035B0E1C9
MQHRINPKVDCVFKALLGAEENRALLIDFLNAMLIDTLPRPISAVRILDPYNPRETLKDKLTIVDVKARDAAGRVFQIEIQRDDRSRHRCGSCLTAPYGWADLYRRQLRRGQDYSILSHLRCCVFPGPGEHRRGSSRPARRVFHAFADARQRARDRKCDSLSIRPGDEQPRQQATPRQPGREDRAVKANR